MKNKTAQMAEILMEIAIEAPPERVWQTLTEDIGSWWPAEFFSGGEAGRRDFRLDAKPGGHMGETWHSGGGVLWATVIGVDPGRRLQVTGTAFPAWGGPSQWLGTWELEAQGGGTRLRFIENSIGRVGDHYVADKHKGWAFLWETLKAEIEGGKKPAWQA